MEQIQNVLKDMSRFSNAVLEPAIAARLRILSEKPDPYELERIIDECVYGSLCSDNIIRLMTIIRDQ